MNALGPADIRHANTHACIAALRATEKPLSIADLSAATGLSRPTVDAVLATMEQRGLVAALAPEMVGAGGRPARRYAMDATNGIVAGIDAGPHNVRVMLADLRGRVIACVEHPVPAQPSAEARLDFVADVITEALTTSGAAPAALRAACVAVSGILSDDGRLVDSIAVPEWNGLAIADLIGTRFDCAALLENDIKLAALAEHHAGAARDVDDILFIQIGNRISLGQTAKRQIFQGAHRSAGEVGSLRGMRWASNSVKGQLTWRSAQTAEEVFAHATGGDEAAMDEVRTFTQEIAPLLATVSLVVDPARIIVGGGLTRSGDLFVDMLRAEIDHLVVLPRKPEVVASPLGSRATAVGAMALAFETWSSELFGVSDVPVPEIALTRGAVAA